MKNVTDEDYVYKLAKTPTEVKELIKDGFEYMCDQQGRAGVLLNSGD